MIWDPDDEEFDGVERDTDAWLEAADNAREAEMDRQIRGCEL